MKSIKEEIEMTQNDSKKITYEDLDVPDFVEILEGVLGYKRVPERQICCDDELEKLQAEGIAIPPTLQSKQCPYCDECDAKDDYCPYCGSGYKDDVEELGWYDCNKKTVYLCIDRIEKVSRRLGYDISIVKNIVRLHENIHAYTHQKLQDKYEEIPRYIDEPVTEFLTYCICLYFGGDSYVDCFEKIPRLPCYRGWNNIYRANIIPVNIRLNDLLNNLIKNKQLTKDKMIKSLFGTLISISEAVCTYRISNERRRVAKWIDFYNLFKLEFYHEFEIISLKGCD
jgi:hypothetical protein